MTTPLTDAMVPWPDEYVQRYVAAGYWAGRPLGDLLEDAASRTPDFTALVDGEVRLTYAELIDRADSLAANLAGVGIRAGHCVIVQLANTWEFVVMTIACLRGGVVPIMALPAHRTNELAHLARQAGAMAIAVPEHLRGFDHQSLAHGLAKHVDGPWHVLVVGDDIRAGSFDIREMARPKVGGPGRSTAARAPHCRDVAVFLLSGGTTGLPKLIARTHDDYAYNARASAAVSGVDATTVYLVALPAGHNFPLACPGIIGTLINGGRVVMLASPEPSQAFATIARERVTHTSVVPAIATTWMDHAMERGAEELATLQVLQVGGARMADELARRVRPTLGTSLQQVFGMAEGLLNYTRLDDPDDVVCTTQGRPISPDDEIRLVDEFDVDVDDGEPGSLLTRGPYTPRGYFAAAEHNARAFTNDGWYRSGDICRRTPEGNLVVAGRDKDMINRGGEKISAEEVENLMYQLPAIAQVAAVAMPDRILGERVCAYVVLRPGRTISLEEIQSWMEQAEVAKYKWPERLAIVDSLPVTNVGKIDKKAMRADITERIAAESRP